MSSIALSGNASGAGVFTIASPNSASSFTATLPAATTTLVGTDATQTLTNKTLTTPNINSAQFATVSGTAPIYPCRAWVNFNGTTNTGGFCTVRGSGNVTSVADNSTGNYTVNLTTAMPDVNYSVLQGGVSGALRVDQTTLTTSAFTVLTTATNSGSGGVQTDQASVFAAVFR